MSFIEEMQLIFAKYQSITVCTPRDVAHINGVFVTEVVHLFLELSIFIPN